MVETVCVYMKEYRSFHYIQTKPVLTSIFGAFEHVLYSFKYVGRLDTKFRHTHTHTPVQYE